MGVIINGSGDGLAVKLMPKNMHLEYPHVMIIDIRKKFEFFAKTFEFFAKTSHGMAWVWSEIGQVIV